MKKKKQLKIILAILTALVIMIGGWLLMTPGSLSAKEAQKLPEVRIDDNNIPASLNADEKGNLNAEQPIDAAGDFGTVFDSTDSWLPDYKPGLDIGGGGWLDSADSYIPKKNAYGFKYYDGKNGAIKTQIIGWSKGIGIHKQADGSLTYDYGVGWEASYGNLAIYNNYVQMNVNETATNRTGQQWILFNNIGFYNGKPLAGLMKITPAQDLSLPTNVAKDLSSIGIGLNEQEVTGVHTGAEDSLLSVIMGKQVPYMDVSYEFYDVDGAQEITAPDGEFPNMSTYQQINIKPYLVFDKLKADKFLTFNSDQLSNVYSTSLNANPSEEKSTIIFSEAEAENGKLQLTNSTTIVTAHPLSHLFTMTPKKSQDMQYHLSVNTSSSIFKENNGAYYSVATPVKVEFPDPQPTTTIYDKIIGDGTQGITTISGNNVIEKFGNQFVQSIPWEMGKDYYKNLDPNITIDNRTQFPEWTLKSSSVENKAVDISGDWDVESLDDPTLPTGNWFDFEKDANTGMTVVKPKDDTLITDKDSKFYNHYYKFKNFLNINYDPDNKITKDALTEQTGKPFGYANAPGWVQLTVDDSDPTLTQEAGMNKNPPEEVAFKTQINFIAPITYKFVDMDGKPFQADELGQGVVTWDAPLVPVTYATDGSNLAEPTDTKGPDITGYRFISAKLNDQDTDWQVKVTNLLKEGGDATEAEDYDQNNVVTLTYAKVNYPVVIDIVNPQRDIIIQPNATADFEVSVDNGKTWVRMADFDFSVGTPYLLKQTGKVTGYQPEPDNSPTFEVELKADGTYSLKQPNPNDSNNPYQFTWDNTAKQLKITVTNQPNALTLTVEPNLYFTKTTVPLPSGNNQIIERDPAKGLEGEDWTVTVNGSGVPVNKTGYKVKAQLMEDFTDTASSGNKAKLKNVLYFKNDKNDKNDPNKPLTAGGDAVELFNNSDEQANTSMDKPFDFKKKWDNTAGFYLDLSFAKSLDIYGNIVSKGPTATSATYTAPIEVSLDYLPED